MTKRYEPATLFISYARADEPLCKELEKHLKPLQREALISTWHDRQIEPGANWAQMIDEQLENASIILLLISADFLASDYCYGIEMQRALERHQAGVSCVIPIILRPTSWQDTPFSKLQVLPSGGKVVTDSPYPHDDAFKQVADSIRRVVMALRRLVFIVSSTPDQQLVTRLSSDLQVYGITAHSSREKIAGQDTETQGEESVFHEMQTIPDVLLIASPDTPHSPLVKEQLNLAKIYRCKVIVLWIRGDSWKDAIPEGWNGQQVIDAREISYDEMLQKVLICHRSHEFLTSPLVSSPHEPEIMGEPRNPYKGLRAFRGEDSRDFFGRGELVKTLIDVVEQSLEKEQWGKKGERLIAVVGPSGSGKSSVVMAGLLPRLQSGALVGSQEWIYLEMTPGKKPLESLTITLSRQMPEKSFESLRQDLEADSDRGLHWLTSYLTKQPGARVVLLIDQFEELFTRTTSESERQHFIDLLIAAVTEPQGVLIVLLTLRADFSDRPMYYPELHQLIEACRISVPPIDIQNLRDVIEKPAQLPDVQLTFQDSLVSDLLFEMYRQIGALPLLQFTLHQLFEQRNGHLLTIQSYHEIGGIKGVLLKYAEETYQSLPSDEHRTLTRTLFLRLINPGVSEQETTRRLATLADISFPSAEQTHAMLDVIDRFVKGRLLMTREDEGITRIEVSHEALIREWTRLAEWLREAREDIVLHQTISTDVANWMHRGRPMDHLYQQSKLIEAQEWATRNIPNQEEATFLQVSRDEQQHRQVHEQERQVRELILQRRVVSRQRFLVVALSIFSVIVIVLASLAEGGRETANTLRLQANYQTDQALNQAQIARANALTADADSALSQNDLSRALLLSSKATQEDNNYEARDVLLRSLEQSQYLEKVLRYSPSSVLPDRLTFLNDGHTLFTTDLFHMSFLDTLTNQEISLGDISQLYGDNPHEDAKASFGALETKGVAISPDGRSLVIANMGGVLFYPNLGSQKSQQPISLLGSVKNVRSSLMTILPTVFSNDGKLLASGRCSEYTAPYTCQNEQIFIWDAHSHQHLRTLTVEATTGYSLTNIAFSPDNTTLASVTSGSVQVWNLKDGTSTLLSSKSDANDQGIAFSPNGKLLAFTAKNHAVQIWDTDSRQLVGAPLIGHIDTIEDLAFSPNSKLLASASDDKTVHVWDVTSQRTITTLDGDATQKRLVAFSPDGRFLVSESLSGTIALWYLAANSTISRSIMSNQNPLPKMLAFHDSVVVSPDGQGLITGEDDGRVVLRNINTGKPFNVLTTAMYPLLSPPHDPYDTITHDIQSLALSKDGHILAAGRHDGTISLWNMKTGEQEPFIHPADPLHKVLLSENGNILVSVGDKTVQVWNVSQKKGVFSYHYQKYSFGDERPVALSPNGEYLAIGDCAVTEFADSGNFCKNWQIQFFDMKTKKPVEQPIAVMENITDIAFHPDGHTLAWSTQDGIFMKALGTKRLSILSVPADLETQEYQNLLFSPNGTLLLSYSSSGFTVWDIKQSKQLFTYVHQDSQMEAIAFTPDSKHLVSVDNVVDTNFQVKNITLTLWDISTEGWQQQACALANRNLTEEEWTQFIGNTASYRNVCPLLPATSSIRDPLLTQLKNASGAAQAGHTQQALKLYQNLTKRARVLNDADFDNEVCWEGSVHQFAQTVAPACEYAVDLDPGNADYRDSRGLARALMNNKSGAIDDFQFYIDWTTSNILNVSGFPADILNAYRSLVDKRVHWIKALKAGNNPFNTTILHALENE